MENVLAGYLTEAAAAKQLGRSMRTLQIWRSRGKGPSFTRMGRGVLYRVDALRDWLLSNEVTPVREKRR